PDGKFLLYRCQRGPTPGRGMTLLFRSVETGEVRDLQPKLRRIFFTPSWSPDGRFIAVHGQDLQGHSGVFRIDVRSGEVNALKLSDRQDYGRISWGRDSKSIYFYSRENFSGEGFLARRDLESDHEEILLRSKTAV